MLECTRRELIAAFLGAPLAAACSRERPRALAGELLGQDFTLGHQLRDGLALAPVQTRKLGCAIVGAGVAGLSAAWRLSRAGQQDYEVLELESVPGGTARAGHNSLTRYPWAAHYLPCPLPHARAVRALLLEMGVARERADGELDYDETQLVRAPQERLFVADRWYEGLFPQAGSTQEDLAQLARFEAEVDALTALRDGRGRRAFAVPIAHASDDAQLLALDRLSFADWCSERGFDSRRLRFWLEYGTKDDMGSTLEQTSAYAGLHYHAARATENGASRFLTWPEGNARLVGHMARGAGARLRTGAAVTRVRARAGGGYELLSFEPGSGRCEALHAEHVIFAVPLAILARILQPPPLAASLAASSFQTGAWLVANISLRRRPRERGFPECWDNVLYGSKSVGYVVATHQADSRERQRTVWTWYLPLTSADPSQDRRQLLGLDFEQCAQLVLADLTRAHPDLAECIERIDVFRWGHAMIRPRPGVFTGELAALRRSLQQPAGGLHFAHSELSGLALFEEAQYHGVRAAEEVLAARGVDTESLL
jgi:protoporphyrinogen oxidase